MVEAYRTNGRTGYSDRTPQGSHSGRFPLGEHREAKGDGIRLPDEQVWRKTQRGTEI
ncbi:hypothetical protein D1872_343590 [compost metagenome]